MIPKPQLIRILANRTRYKGGRKFKSAWRRLGPYRMSDIYKAGCIINLVFADHRFELAGASPENDHCP